MNRALLDFLLYDWLKVKDLVSRERFADHGREIFGAVVDTAERLARDKFAPFNRLVDIEAPGFDGERVTLPRAIADATHAESGLIAAGQDAEIGSLQLPCVVEMAANAFFYESSIARDRRARRSGIGPRRRNR